MYGLGAVDTRQTDFFARFRSAMVFAQLVAQFGHQRIMRAGAQIGDGDVFSLALAACCTYRDEDTMVRQSPDGHSYFGPHLVAGVDHAINIFGKNSGPIARLDKCIDTDHLASGVDGRDTLPHGIDLRHPQGVAGCLNLAIDVGLGNVVHINQGDASDPCAGQGFSSPRTHTTDAYNADVGSA